MTHNLLPRDDDQPRCCVCGTSNLGVELSLLPGKRRRWVCWSRKCKKAAAKSTTKKGGK